MKKLLFIFLCLIFMSVSLIAQTTGNITIQRNTNFQTALRLLENLSIQHEQRNIVNFSSYSGGIPVQINNLPWRDALHLIVNSLDLQIESRPGVFIISDITEIIEDEEDDQEIHVDMRMVRIHATFFHADRTFLNSLGINWSTLIDGEVIANIDFRGGDYVSDQILTISSGHTFEQGGTLIGLEALFKFMESNQRGSILARPTIMVMSGKDGNIQVGQDFSVKTLDEQGNTTDQFFETGIILNVKPTIITDDETGFEAIHLQAKVENSNAVPGALTILVNKQFTQTDVMLFDGEEIVMAGLIDNEISYERGGIPFLKDLPWWVFGLRYIFGYETTRQTNREMIVILKAEIVAPARDRIRQRDNVRETIRQLRREFEGSSTDINSPLERD
jgi:type IV pilus assembly protein PilQ